MEELRKDVASLKRRLGGGEPFDPSALEADVDALEASQDAQDASIAAAQSDATQALSDAATAQADATAANTAAVAAQGSADAAQADVDALDPRVAAIEALNTDWITLPVQDTIYNVPPYTPGTGFDPAKGSQKLASHVSSIQNGIKLEWGHPIIGRFNFSDTTTGVVLYRLPIEFNIALSNAGISYRTWRFDASSGVGGASQRISAILYPAPDGNGEYMLRFTLPAGANRVTFQDAVWSHLVP